MARCLRRPLASLGAFSSSSPIPRRCFSQIPSQWALRNDRPMPAHSSAQPSVPSLRVARAQQMDAHMISDIGIAQQTFIRPRGANAPSLFRNPKGFWRILKASLFSAAANYMVLVYTKLSSPVGGKRWWNKSFQIRRRARVPTALALHKDMYKSFAAADDAQLKKICLDGLYESFAGRIRRRARGEKMAWELVRYHGRPKVVVDRAVMLNMDIKAGCLVRQITVRIDSSQKLTRRLADGSLAKGSGQAKRVVEYLVLQKKFWKWQEYDWQIWGTTEETTLEDVLEWDRAAKEGKTL